MQGLLQAVEASLSPEKATREAAEEYLKQTTRQPGNLLLLAQGIGSGTAAPPVAQAAAVYFKNVVKNYWEPEDRENALNEADKARVRENVVGMVVASPYEIQRQLTEALSIIAKTDFPAKWESLLPELVEKLKVAHTNNDFALIYGCLLIANEVMKRFRYVYKSDELFLQLKYCLDHFQETLTVIFRQSCAPLASLQGDANSLTKLLEILRLCARIFFSLNYQDIPEYFEDNLAQWMGPFDNFLGAEFPAINGVNAARDQPNPLAQLQAAIIENVMLYADKYDEQFAEHLPSCTRKIWALLTTISPEPRNDQLATKGITFLTRIISKQLHYDIFKEESTLRQMVTHVVLPNIMLRELEEELFEMSPTEFIQRDMEGSDTDTRRRCARDLVRGMCKLFGQQTTQIVGEHIQVLLKEYQANPEQNWRQKDAALHLILAVTVRAESKKGVREVNEAINVMEMLSTHVLPELQDSNVAARPIVKASAIKFANTFRGQMSVTELSSLMPLYIRHMGAELPVVVQTYACIAVERILTLRDRAASGSGKVQPLVFTRSHLSPFMEPLTQGIFHVLSNDEVPENDYVMKALMRVLCVAQEEVQPVYQQLTQTLTSTLGRVWKNPSNPHFGHYLFECIGILVGTITKTVPGSGVAFEELLFPPFQAILQEDVAQLTPYVFQIMAQLLEASENVSDAFWQLLPILLTPVTWQRKSNTPALVRFLVAYMKKAGRVLAEQGKIEAVLAIAQKLVSSRANEISSFQLLEMVVLHVPQDHLSKYLVPLMQVLLTRLQQNNNLKFIRLISYFWCVIINKFGVATWWSTLESVQAGLAMMLSQSIFLSNAARHKNWSAEELKCFCDGIVSLLVQGPILGQNPALWGSGVGAVVQVLMRDSGADGDDEEDGSGIAAEMEVTYDATYSRLAFASAAKIDAFPNLPPPLVYLPRCLAELGGQQPLLPVLQQQLTPDQQAALQQMCQSAGVTLT
uniref:Importin N-terminal domain-containing protein n=1 Tax=Phaeomonas parva TaxID=124430 RepID=A0A7S1XYB3_9STRA|mmetsp:Transcript_44344/g.139258  ORF Transcript_44344/g.139258 Transcript_44344/m.139258 type:complete len:974 (+) Transcript_44344:91-3012(+)